MSSESSALLDARIKLTFSQSQLVELLLREWTERHLLTAQQQAQLLGTIETQGPFNWQRLAKYTFRLSTICFAIALLSLVADQAFLKLIRKILEAPAFLRALFTCLVAIAIHKYGVNRQQAHPLQIWANEAVHAFGAIVLGLAAIQLAEALGVFKSQRKGGHPERARWVVLLLGLCYGVVGLLVSSTLIWSSSMAALGSALGLWTVYASGRGAYFMDMEYPIRFVIFGFLLIGTAQAMKSHVKTAKMWSATRVWGLLYMFLALWILSIFGNDQFSSNKGYSWRSRPGQPRLLAWSLAFGVAAGVCIWHGLRFADSVTKGFGVAFLAINLYTKFFEFFWDRWYKPLFFAVLAASLALLGHYAELLQEVVTNAQR